MAAFYRVDQPDMAARRDDDEPASMDDVAVHVLVQMLIGEKAAKPLGLGKVVGGPVSMVFALDECVFQHSLKGLQGMGPVVNAPRSACGASQHTISTAAASSVLRSSVP